MRWTVDEPEDYKLVEKIYQALYEDNPQFLMNDILNLLDEHPELAKINDNFIRNKGLEKSLQEDMELALKKEKDFLKIHAFMGIFKYYGNNRD